MAIFGHSQTQNVGKTPVAVASPGAACNVFLHSQSPTPVWVGNASNITPTTGCLLPPGGLNLPVTGACTIYACTNGANATVHAVTGA